MSGKSANPELLDCLRNLIPKTVIDHLIADYHVKIQNAAFKNMILAIVKAEST